jgi:chaperonin cofactor prefoldin
MTEATPSEAAVPTKTRQRVKVKMSLKKQLAIAHAEKQALETTLRDTTSALEESVGREQAMCREIEGRVGRLVGEHPVGYAKRVAARIDELVKKNAEIFSTNQKEHQEFLRKQQGYKSEIQLLNGQLNALEGVLKGAVQMAEAGKAPAHPPDAVSPTGRILEDAIDRIMSPVSPFVGFGVACKRPY